MEEDIKIQDLIEHIRFGTQLKYDMKTYLIAIENLITRYKELQKQLEEKEMQHELELIGKEEYTKADMGEIIENYYTANEDCILKSKAEEMLEEIDEELEEMKVDNMYGRYDDYGGKRKFNEQFSYKFGEKEALQELIED